MFCKPQERAEPLFGQSLDAWLADTRLRVKRSTYATYRGVAERHVRPELGDVPLGSLTSGRLAMFLAETEKSLAPSTVRLVCWVVRGTISTTLNRV